MKWDKELELAKQAALAAGSFLQKADRNDILSTKGRDIKHRADLNSENIILSFLKQNSDYAFLAEESGKHGAVSRNVPLWIIDPLDGTLNYSRLISFCCVSIALWQGNSPLLGVIYDFNHNDLFYGIPAQGAWLNGVRIYSSTVKHRKHAVLATGFPVNRDFSDNSLFDFIADVQNFKKIRLFGSAALSLAYVACGRVDAYREEDIMFWDVAAGIALVEASNGYVKHLSSGDNDQKKSIYAGQVFNQSKEETPL